MPHSTYTHHLFISLLTNLLSLEFLPRYSSNSLCVWNFFHSKSIFPNYKLKLRYFIPYLYTHYFINYKLMLRYFLPCFVFYCRAPVRILFQFNANRMGRYPSSLSARNAARNLTKHRHAEQKIKRKGWGLWGFWAFSLSFFG